MSDMATRFDAQMSLAPAGNRNASSTGTGVDLANFHAAVVEFTAGDWTDGTHTAKVMVSDDDGATDPYAAAAAEDLTGDPLPVIDAAGDENTVSLVGYIGSKRWVRGDFDVAGATTGAQYSVNVLRMRPRKLPK